MTHSSREMKRRRESSLRLRRHHRDQRRREGAPFCPPPLLFLLLFVLQASSLKSFFVSSCVPTIRCPNGEDVVTTTTIRTCRAEWQCTWSAIAPKTNGPKRFSLLRGLADILNENNNDSEALQRSAFNMTNVKGHSVVHYSMTIQPSCSRVGCDVTKTSITLQTPDASDSFTSKDCLVEETAKKCGPFDAPSNRNDREVFSEATATLKCQNNVKPCSGSSVLVSVDFEAEIAAPPRPPVPPGLPNSPPSPPAPFAPPMPPAAFAPGGQGRKFFQMFLVLVAVYCSVGYALALAITRGRWSGFTEACIRDGKGRNSCGLLFFWWWPRFWTEEDERCLDAFYDEEERGERRLLDGSSTSEGEEEEESESESEDESSSEEEEEED